MNIEQGIEKVTFKMPAEYKKALKTIAVRDNTTMDELVRSSIVKTYGEEIEKIISDIYPKIKS